MKQHQKTSRDAKFHTREIILSLTANALRSEIFNTDLMPVIISITWVLFFFLAYFGGPTCRLLVITSYFQVFLS